MTEIWRSSDEHYGDPAVARHRGFGPSTKEEWAAASPTEVAAWKVEHNEMVIDRLTKVATQKQPGSSSLTRSGRHNHAGTAK